MFVIDDLILAAAMSEAAPIIGAEVAGAAALGAGEAAGAAALGTGMEGLAALSPEAAMYGAGSGLGIPPAATMGPQVANTIAGAGSQPAAATIAGAGSQPAANVVATGIDPLRTPEFQRYIDQRLTAQAAPYGQEIDYVSGNIFPKTPTTTPPSTDGSFFDKAYEWAKKNPGLAISGGMLGLQTLDRMTNRGIGGFPTYTPGPLDKIRLSPDFKAGRVDPSKYVYTPGKYNAGGTIDASQSVNMAKGGDPGAAMMAVYDRMMSRQSRADYAPGDTPSPARGVGIVQDTDPDTRNLDALRATQVRMAKLRKRTGLPSESMPAYSSLGAMNVGLGKSGGADQELAKGGMLGMTGLGDYAAGGMPRLLKGPGDGMSDDIPATINNRQPARLADGEFVVPADVVSHLGNGSTDAGAKKLHEMMNKVRHARTGNPKQGKQIKPDKYLPK
jgi:hypothetical protein